MPNLDHAFSALADPTRRAILARLASGEATVMELAEPFEMTQPAISRHLKVLEGAGLIVRRVEGTKRPCRLAPAGIDPIDGLRCCGKLWRRITSGWTRCWPL
jgi:DNA-binding transcriptional ArsR family regulator